MKILVIFTGGTIGSSVSDGAISPNRDTKFFLINDFYDRYGKICEFLCREPYFALSENLNADTLNKLVSEVKSAMSEDFDGIIVTHGTDTLEETSYFLDLLHKNLKPVVMTAAMRGADEASPDGPMNIYCAVKTASSEQARGMGVLVCMNETLHAAGEVSKTHSANPATFESPWWGPVGYVDDDKVVVGFAGSVADAFSLCERFEEMLNKYSGNLMRSAVELAQLWRGDKVLRKLEAMMIVADSSQVLILSGNGDVIEPSDGVCAIGSGGNYALAAAKALIENTKLSAKEIAKKALEIAGKICVFTNDHLTVEEI